MRQLHLSILLLTGLLSATGAWAEGARARPDQPEVGDALKSGDVGGAFRVSREKAEQGEIEAQYNLALFYWHGVGAPQNFEEAMRWATLSAIRGHRKATSARSLMQRSIEPQLAQKSMEWSRQRLIKQAEGGDNEALTPLAVSYRSDFGFPNEAEAYFWSSLAVSLGKAEARRQRDALVQSMSQSDVVKTQQKASQWIQKWRKEQS